MCSPRDLMYIEVQFQRIAHDPSLEAAVQRWVARFAAMNIEVRRAKAVIEPFGRRATAVTLSLVLSDGRDAAAAITHVEPYVAISEAFRAARRQLVSAAPARMLAYA